MNCLKSNHQVKDCRASDCRVCNKRHNTLLLNATPEHTTHITDSKEIGQAASTQSTYTGTNVSKQIQVLLTTALVEVQDSTGDYQTCRVLLDNASHSNFVTMLQQIKFTI